MSSASSYELRSVVHLVRPTGARARTLGELRTCIREAPPHSLFFHTRHTQLRNPAIEDSALDDFSAWVNGVVQDRETAERLSFAVESRSENPEALREGLLDALSRLSETTQESRGAPAEGEFVFLTIESVPLTTGTVVRSGRELVHALHGADASVWFYHLIEQPWFPDGPLVFDWLLAQGEDRLEHWLREDASSNQPIEVMRRRLLQRWRRSRLGRRISEAATAPEDTRREAGRATVARFVRRITQNEPPR